MMWTDNMRHTDGRVSAQAYRLRISKALNNERFQGMAGKGKE